MILLQKFSQKCISNRNEKRQRFLWINNTCEKAKLCYMDTDSFIVYIKTDDIYKDIAEDAETRFDT